MTYDQLSNIVDNIRYKHGWYLHSRRDGETGRVYLQWSFTAPDYASPGKELTLWYCRKHYLSVHMTEGEVVQTALMAALQAEEHECREAFTYCGQALFNPHIDIRTLMSVCGQTKGRE